MNLIDLLSAPAQEYSFSGNFTYIKCRGEFLDRGEFCILT